jgi:NCS1 family nucleobase:cation symporter-1
MPTDGESVAGARLEAMRRHPGELYELVAAPADPRLANADLLPTPVARRTWSAYNVAALWVGLSVCIPTYMLAAGLVESGMSAVQAIGTIFLGNLIVLLPMVAVAHAGTRYGLSFPVLARAAFGPAGAHVPAMLRALVACGWFGIQTWIGGQAIHTMLSIAFPPWREVPGGAWIGFALFWLWNLWIVVRGSEAIKRLEAWAAPLLLAGGIALLFWAASSAGGLGPILARPGRFTTAGDFFSVFVPSLTAMVGFWATLALNIPDLMRYARSQRAQAVGQLAGLPTTMTLFSFIGVAVTSASVILYGQAIWDPVVLLGKLGSPLAVLLGLAMLLVATITTNVAANVVAPANGFANLWPEKISFAAGGVITGILGIAMMPWKLLSDFSTYIFGWLVGYSGLLGPVAGILIADYWWVRRGALSLDDLYRSDGLYGRVNGRAVAALAAGIAVALVGLLVPPLRPLFDYAWFVGFAVAFLLYGLLMRGTPRLDLSRVPQAGTG